MVPRCQALRLSSINTRENLKGWRVLDWTLRLVTVGLRDWDLRLSTVSAVYVVVRGIRHVVYAFGQCQHTAGLNSSRRHGDTAMHLLGHAFAALNFEFQLPRRTKALSWASYFWTQNNIELESALQVLFYPCYHSSFLKFPCGIKHTHFCLVLTCGIWVWLPEIRMWCLFQNRSFRESPLRL